MSTPSTTPVPQLHRHPLTLLGLLIGVALAPLCAYSSMPLPSMYNQLLAFLGFGLVLAGLSMGRALHGGWRLDGGSVLLLMLLVVTLIGPMIHGTPVSVALGGVAPLLAALLIVQTARALRWELRDDVLTSFCLALVLAGVLSFVVGAIQLFAPALTDNLIIANTNHEGRAIGNMRQPNQLASLLLWSSAGAVWLAQSGWLQRRLGSPLRATLALGALLWMFVLGILFSASRTGIAGIGLLAVWALVDAVLAKFGKARLRRDTRIALGLTPVMWLISWPIVSWAIHALGLAFFTEARLSANGAQSQERLMIFRDTFALLKDRPWTGTGWGGLNFEWTMTPFPDRFAAFVDHTHNIFLQFVTELGWPLGVIASVLLLAGVALAVWRGAVDKRGAGICALMLVLVIGLHSQSEFPLWYAHFLLPTAFAYGLCLVRAPAGEAAQPSDEPEQPRKDLALAGALMVILVPAVAKQYLDVVHIYEPPPGAPALIERIATGEATVLFDLHADYAIATVLPPGQFTLAAAQRASYRLIDARLMVAWARSLNAVGQTDKARFLAQRLAEFHHPLGDEFFKECQTVAADAPRPFQCDPPTRTYAPSEMR